jgi:flagellar hook-length control protein FliK
MAFDREVQALSGTGVKGSAPAGAREALPSAYRQEVYEKFGQGLRMTLAGGGKEVRVKLVPERLGELLIKVSRDANGVSAKIVVESAAIKGILESDAGRLKGLFAEQGLELNKFSVEVGSHWGGAEKENPWADNGRGRFPGAQARRVNEEINGLAAGPERPWGAGPTARLDLFA